MGKWKNNVRITSIIELKRLLIAEGKNGIKWIKHNKHDFIIMLMSGLLIFVSFVLMDIFPLFAFFGYMVGCYGIGKTLIDRFSKEILNHYKDGVK